MKLPEYSEEEIKRNLRYFGEGQFEKLTIPLRIIKSDPNYQKEKVKEYNQQRYLKQKQAKKQIKHKQQNI